MVYQHEFSWLVALLIMVISAWIRHYFNLKHSGKNKPSVLISGIAAMCLLAVVISIPSNAPKEAAAGQMSEVIPLTTVQGSAKAIISLRCASCHSSNPTDDVFVVAPSGVVFDSWQDIERWAPRILARSVDTADMPFLNKTGMTDEERSLLKQLLNQAK